MTFDPRKTPPNTLPAMQSDYEESLVPNRSVMYTQNIVDLLVPNVQQGRIATSSDATVYAGAPTSGVGAPQFYRWW